MEVMTPEQQRSAAVAQLGLVLSFFDRVESRLTLVFGVNASMLALLTASLPPYSKWDARLLLVAFSVILIAVSIYHVWHGMFPNVNGGKLENGKTSAVFFGAIAKREEPTFVEDFLRESEQAHTRDLLGQVWINSKILSEKFHCLERAFIWMLAALAPWLAALAVTLAMNPNDKRLLP